MRKQWANFITLKTFPIGRGGGGDVIPKGLAIGSFNYDEENGYLRIVIRRFWEKSGGGDGLVALQCFWSLKKGTITFNFHLNEPSSNIL